MTLPTRRAITSGIRVAGIAVAIVLAACVTTAIAAAATGAPAAAHIAVGRSAPPGPAPAAPDTASQSRPDSTSEVFIVSTLYRRHDAVPVYDLAALRGIIERIAPRVLVLDVTPTELATFEAHGSKIEYTQVIFPLVRTNAFHVYAAEPDEPLFSAIVDPVAARREAMQRDAPDRMAAWQAYDRAAGDLLAHLWQSAADVHAPLTDDVMRNRQHIEAVLFGDDDRDDFERWNAYFASVIRRAAREHAGQRILVLVGIRNRHWLLDALADEPSVRLIDVEAWLRL